MTVLLTLENVFGRRFCLVLSALLFIKLIVVFVLILNMQNESTRKYVYREYDELLLVDEREHPSDVELLALIENELPNLDFKFLNHTFEHSKNGDICGPIPHTFNLKFHDNYWQSYENGNVSFELFGAYYDRRPVLPAGPVVRILAMVSQLEDVFLPSYCQFWFEGEKNASIGNVTEYHGIWNKSAPSPPNHLYPYLLTCNVPAQNTALIPQTVSLTSERCALATNNLKVVYEEPKSTRIRSNFAVCVKSLDFPYVDISARLVEWFELLRIQGVDEVIAYNIQVHPNVTKVLDYYRDEGLLKLTPLTYASGESSLPNFHHLAMEMNSSFSDINEVIPQNDCFYRNMYKYAYLAMLDVDEVIMPQGNLSSWHDLLECVEAVHKDNCTNYASLCINTVDFPEYANYNPYSEKVPAYMYMLQHVQRAGKTLGKPKTPKCLHNTKFVRSLYNNLAKTYFQSCESVLFDSDLVQLQHYTQPQAVDTSILESPVIDANMWRFQAELVNRTVSVLGILGFLGEILED